MQTSVNRMTAWWFWGTTQENSPCGYVWCYLSRRSSHMSLSNHVYMLRGQCLDVLEQLHFLLHFCTMTEYPMCYYSPKQRRHMLYIVPTCNPWRQSWTGVEPMGTDQVANSRLNRSVPTTENPNWNMIICLNNFVVGII